MNVMFLRTRKKLRGASQTLNRKSHYSSILNPTRLKNDSKFWKACLQIARANPSLCAEEVELEAVRVHIGLPPSL